MCRTRCVAGLLGVLLVLSLVGSPSVVWSSGMAAGQATDPQVGLLIGGGFWGGLGCGLAIMGTAAAILSPDPFSKFAAAAYIGTAISCGTAIYNEIF